MPLINGYSDHIPQDFRDNARTLGHLPDARSFAILDPLDTRYAGVSPRSDARRANRCSSTALTRIRGLPRPLESEGDVWLYEIVDWPN